MPDTLSDTYYRLLTEQLGVAVIGVDGDLLIRFWNHAAAHMFGAPANVMIGTPFSNIVPQQHRDRAIELLRQSMTTGEVCTQEFNHRDEHGNRRELITTFAPIVSECGEPIGASACLRDISQRIVLQEELAESRKMVALGELSGSLAHHFNNLFAGIIAGAELARESGDERTMKRALQQTGETLFRAAKLVNGLLAFADGGQKSDDWSDLTEIVTGIVDDLERELHGGPTSLDVSIPTLPIISVPRSQVETIIRSLTQNAMEAMPDGGTLGITLSVDDERICISISDTGRGLDDTDRPHIFEPFWTTKADRFGPAGEIVGFGLSIAQGLAWSVGGSIVVNSQVGQGSCFRFCWPRHPTRKMLLPATREDVRM